MWTRSRTAKKRRSRRLNWVRILMRALGATNQGSCQTEDPSTATELGAVTAGRRVLSDQGSVIVVLFLFTCNRKRTREWRDGWDTKDKSCGNGRTQTVTWSILKNFKELRILVVSKVRTQKCNRCHWETKILSPYFASIFLQDQHPLLKKVRVVSWSVPGRAGVQAGNDGQLSWNYFHIDPPLWRHKTTIERYLRSRRSSIVTQLSYYRHNCMIDLKRKEARWRQGLATKWINNLPRNEKLGACPWCATSRQLTVDRSNYCRRNIDSSYSL